MKISIQWLPLFGVFLGSQHFVMAQTDSTSTLCVLYIERMPELVRAGKPISIAQAVQERLIYPAAAVQAHAEGRAFVSFTVTANGSVENAHLIKGFRPDCDSAALQAVRQLPRFKPARQLGKPVACGYTVPVKFSLPTKPQRIKPTSLLPKRNPKP